MYRPSPRPFPDRLPPIEYPGHFEVCFVSSAGTFRFKKRLLFIANALKQHYIGLEEVDNGVRPIYFCAVFLARLDEPAGVRTRVYPKNSPSFVLPLRPPRDDMNQVRVQEPTHECRNWPELVREPRIDGIEEKHTQRAPR